MSDWRLVHFLDSLCEAIGLTLAAFFVGFVILSPIAGIAYLEYYLLQQAGII